MWILLMDNRRYVVGPFKWYHDAQMYAKDMKLSSEQVEIREVYLPESIKEQLRQNAEYQKG